MFTTWKDVPDETKKFLDGNWDWGNYKPLESKEYMSIFQSAYETYKTSKNIPYFGTNLFSGFATLGHRDIGTKADTHGSIFYRPNFKFTGNKAGVAGLDEVEPRNKILDDNSTTGKDMEKKVYFWGESRFWHNRWAMLLLRSWWNDEIVCNGHHWLNKGNPKDAVEISYRKEKKISQNILNFLYPP